MLDRDFTIFNYSIGAIAAASAALCHRG
jgi:hypothetical protein